MGLVSDFFRSVKDAALAAIAKRQINMHIDFGKVTEFKLDSQAKRINLVLDLKGETEPVSVALHDYCIRKDGEQMFVEIGRITASRDWIAILAQKFIAQKPFEIPVSAKYEWVLNMLV